MITTAEPILRQVSYEIGEATADVSTQRISYFNRAFQQYLSEHRWSFKIKSYDLTTNSNTEYILTTLITDYSQVDGIYEVRTSEGSLLSPIEYTDKDLPQNSQAYYLTPDGKSIGFTSHESGEVFEIKYYAVHTYVTTATENLNVPLPEHHMTPVVTYIKFILADRKRQRNDARNYMLDYKEQLEATIMKDANYKSIGFVPRIFRIRR